MEGIVRWQVWLIAEGQYSDQLPIEERHGGRLKTSDWIANQARPIYETGVIRQGRCIGGEPSFFRSES